MESVGRVRVEGSCGKGTFVVMIDGGEIGDEHFECVGSVFGGTETTIMFG